MREKLPFGSSTTQVPRIAFPPPVRQPKRCGVHERLHLLFHTWMNPSILASNLARFELCTLRYMRNDLVACPALRSVQKVSV